MNEGFSRDDPNPGNSSELDKTAVGDQSQPLLNELPSSKAELPGTETHSPRRALLEQAAVRSFIYGLWQSAVFSQEARTKYRVPADNICLSSMQSLEFSGRGLRTIAGGLAPGLPEDSVAYKFGAQASDRILATKAQLFETAKVRT